MKNRVSRRNFIKTSTLAAGAGLGLSQLLPDAAGEESSTLEGVNALSLAPGEVIVNLLDGKPLSVSCGISFGVPWSQGSITPDARFSLTSDGKQLPLQSWPLAYWPDGSLKWSGFATVVPAGVATPCILSPSSSQASGSLSD